MEELGISQNKIRRSRDRLGSTSARTLSPVAESIFLQPGLPPTCSYSESAFLEGVFARTWGPEPGDSRHSSTSCVSVNMSLRAIRPQLDSSPAASSCFFWKDPWGVGVQRHSSLCSPAGVQRVHSQTFSYSPLSPELSRPEP